MKRIWTIILLLVGCGDFVPKAPEPGRGVMSTSGGGAASSTSHRLRLSIGAPQPMGRATSTSFAVNLGPNQ